MDVQARLDYARAGVAVLRALQVTDRTMHYSDFARAIGLMGVDEAWHIRYRDQISAILYLIAAAERQGGEGKLEFQRLVDDQGKPGTGLYRESRIVVSPPPAVGG